MTAPLLKKTNGEDLASGWLLKLRELNRRQRQIQEAMEDQSSEGEQEEEPDPTQYRRVCYCDG